jgi:hypothetical protein
MAHAACLVYFISTVNSHSKKRKKKKKKLNLGRTGVSSGHITNLKQSILETFDIYGQDSARSTVVTFRKSMQKYGLMVLNVSQQCKG